MDTLFYHTTQDLCKNQGIKIFSFYPVHFLFFLAKKEEKTEPKEKKNAVVFNIFADAQMWFVIGLAPNHSRTLWFASLTLVREQRRERAAEPR